MSKTINACSLHNYFENSGKHRKFSEIVKGLCVGYVFNPKKSPGITVMVPSEKLLAEIEKLADSSKIDDVNKARDLLKSLVLKANIKNNDDWLRYAEDLPNFLNQKVPVAMSGGKPSVNGQAVTMESEFHDTSDGQNLSVWLLQGDKGVGLSNPESKAKLSKVVRKDAKKGSYEAYVYGGEESCNKLRSTIAATVENAAMKASNGVNTYIAYTADLLKYMKEKDEESYKNKLLANITMDSMADFYLLVDPYGMASTPLVNDVSLKSWWADAKTKDVSITGAAACKEIKSDLDATCKSDRVGGALDQARSDIETSNNILKSINNAYSALSSNNVIGGYTGAFNKEYSNFLQSNQDWKLLSDQLKFGVALKSAELDNSGCGNSEKIETLSNMVADYMSNKGRGIVRFCGLSKTDWGNLVGKDDDAHLFVNTDYFMSNAARNGVSGGHQASRLLEGAGSLDEVTNVHQYLCDKNVKAMSAQAAAAHQKLVNTLACFK